MVVAAIIGWAAAGEFGLGTYAGTLIGVIAGLITAYATYLVVVRPIQRSRAIRPEETEIFVLTGTLLWGIMIQVGMAYLFSDNPVTMRPLIAGVVEHFRRAHADQRNPDRRDRLGGHRTALASGQPDAHRQGVARRLHESARRHAARLRAHAALSARVDHLRNCSPASPACCLRPFSASARPMPASSPRSAFSIVVLGGLGSVSGSLIAAYVVGYLETMTAYLIAPTLRPIPRSFCWCSSCMCGRRAFSAGGRSAA